MYTSLNDEIKTFYQSFLNCLTQEERLIFLQDGVSELSHETGWWASWFNRYSQEILYILGENFVHYIVDAGNAEELGMKRINSDLVKYALTELMLHHPSHVIH